MLLQKLFLLFVLVTLLLGIDLLINPPSKGQVLAEKQNQNHWLLLHRKSNIEYLYYGTFGDKEKSKLIKTFVVTTGIPGERPTPLPQLVGRDYWIIIDKQDQKDNPETAPYFLTLDVPVTDQEPYGPVPYLECNGQCNWVLPGDFGLHGIAGDPNKIAKDNPGSSGCIRHTDEDITYLYEVLHPEKEEIRYYIEDI